MGEIISMMDGLYNFELPKMPSDEKEILYYDIPKKEQYWGTPLDKKNTTLVKDVKLMSEKDRIEYIEWNRDKWLNGLWMFINGEPTWITGNHFDFLKFCNFEDFGGKSMYLDQQRYDFYFKKMVWEDTNAYGSCILKPRRCGMTSEELAEDIYVLLSGFNNKIGLQSNEMQKKCLPELMKPLINLFFKRPKWMRGKYYSQNNKRPVNSLQLTPVKVSDEDDYNDFGSDINADFLGGTVMAYPTVSSAMDGSKKKKITMDEVWKWLEASPKQTYEINKKCVVQYGINGKLTLLSTMGDSDSYGAAIKEGMEIYKGSNPLVRDPNGRTTSGLLKWFISGIHSADIPEMVRDPSYTKYGKVNKDACLAYIWNEVNKYTKGSKDYIFALRRLPPTEKHALLSAVEKTYFRSIEFTVRLDYLYGLPADKKPYRRGNLVEKEGKVYFEDNEMGIWLVAVLPYVDVERNINTANRFKKYAHYRATHIKPPANPEYYIGYDPIKFKTASTKGKNLSQVCITVGKKFDYFSSGIANRICAMALWRPDDPKDGHYELLKACKLWAAPAEIERNVGDTESYFDENFAAKFLLRDKDGKVGTYTSAKTTEDGLNDLISYFSAPKTPEDEDLIDFYPFEAGIEDKLNFDLSKTLDSHATMSEIMLMKAFKLATYTNVTDGSIDTVMQAINQIVPMR